MWTRVSRLPTLAVAVAAVAIICSASALRPAHAEIKIGFQAPLTGLAASDGHAARVAAELAIDDINASGGVLGEKLRLITYDDQAKSDQAIFTANKLIGEDGVKFAVSGSYSAGGRAAAPIFQKAGIVFISSYGVHPDITRAGDYVFRLIHLGQPQGRAGAKFVGDTLKLKRVSVVTMDNDYGEATVEGFINSAEKFGIKILNKYTYSLQDRQFGSIVASVKRDNPEAIYATGYFFTGGPLVAQLRAAGITAPIIASQAFDSAKFIEIAGAAANGVYIVASLDPDSGDPKLKNFSREFQKRAGYLPVSSAGQVYSTFTLLADAIKRAGVADPAKVRDALAATSNFPTLQGTLVKFSQRREINMPLAVNVVKNGKFTFHSWIDDLQLLASPDK